MRSLLLLIMLWLALQFGSLLMDGRHPRGSAARGVRSPSAEQVDQVLRQWPTRSREIVENMIAQCGRPDLAREDLMCWDHRGEIGILLYRDGTNRAAIATAGREASARRDARDR